MKSEEDPRVTRRISFLRDALTYLENRIRLVDNKASILALIQTALFGLFAWAKGLDGIKLLPNITCFGISFSFVLEFLVISLTFCTLLLLIQVVRPTKRILFGLKADLGDYGESNYVMWPRKGFPESPEDYAETLNSFNETTIENNYREANYIALKLIDRKYKYYRLAGFLFKWMILLGFIRLLIAYLEVPMSPIPIHKFLAVLSAACFIVGTAFLAKSIKWQSDTLAGTDDSELAKKVREMGSPGCTEVRKLRMGMSLNAVGYALLVISTVISS